MPILGSICEICGTEKWLTPQEGFAEGWDYAPRMYPFKVMRIYNEPDSIINTEEGENENAD